ncbi:MAG: sulfotransferase family protein [Steroidobacterales bacterium]
MIEGFVEQVLPTQISGWAFDRDHPSLHVLVDIFCGDRDLGSTTANVYRRDLARSQFGQGDHGFLLLLPSELSPLELAAVVVQARTGSDRAAARELPRYVRRDPAGAAQIAPRLSVSAYREEMQFPVFVLGSPRSGTSAVAQSLITATPYAGYNEGQVLDLLIPLLRALKHFYESKAHDLPSASRAMMMITKVPEEYFADGISALFADAVRPLFPSRHWCDKTPTADMIWATPSLLRIWPNAKFIFLKRRALENLLSRIRKFRGVSFEYQCSDWVACMDAWRAVRGALVGHALELDHHFLARHPDQSAEAIGALLALAPNEVEGLTQLLSRHQPERTSASILDVADASAIDWDSAQWATFERICGPTMAAYGYSRDQSYYAPGAEDRSCLAI